MFLTVCTPPVPGPADTPEPADDQYCAFTPATTDSFVPGLIVGADVVLPEGRAVHGQMLKFRFPRRCVSFTFSP